MGYNYRYRCLFIEIKMSNITNLNKDISAAAATGGDDDDGSDDRAWLMTARSAYLLYIKGRLSSSDLNLERYVSGSMAVLV